MRPADQAAAIRATADTLTMQFHAALHALRLMDPDLARRFAERDDDFRRIGSIVLDLAGTLDAQETVRCDRSDHDHGSIEIARACYRIGGAR